MAIIKCKMCGGDVHVAEDKTFGTCEYCGSTMTFPKVSDDQRAAAFNRGNHFRRTGEFDKALAVYERIVAEDDTDAEAHWCCALCRFGIEYVEDPATFEWLPTCHRASFDSFLEDVDYLAAIEHSDGITRRQYQKDAAKIAEVQKGILATSQNTEPYDVFISYKELDENGNRTRDSILAQEIYYQLTEKGWRVFFSRISLEDVPGTQYEPYIFAALNSAKVMVVVGTSAENLNAVWVKNEWSRYLALMRKDRTKLLLPCYRDMDPYDLPEQLSVLMSYDMGKIGFIQDLIRGIDKVLSADKKEKVSSAIKETVVVNAGNASVGPLLKRAFLSLEDGEWQRADEFCEQVLNQDPENAQAYLGKLLAELHVRRQVDLRNCDQPFDGSNNYRKALRFSDEKLASTLKEYVVHINERNENKRLKGIYDGAVKAMNIASSMAAYKSAAEVFSSISGFKDADKLAEECLDKAEVCRKDAAYSSARSLMTGEKTVNYESAIKEFQKISGWKDADEQTNICRQKIEEIKTREETERLEQERKAELDRLAAEKVAKRRKKLVSIGLPIIAVSTAVIIILINVVIPKIRYNAFASKYGQKIAEQFYEVEVGQTVNLGSYEQDNNLTNGKEEMEWIVLTKDNSRILLISKYGLDTRPYHLSRKDITWEKSSIRKWLNRQFLTESFSSEENAVISTVTVSADANPNFNTDSGSDTEDKVFLLSYDEVSKFFSTDMERKCIPTAYAVSQGCFVSNGSCLWWLRSPGFESDYAAYIDFEGAISMLGHTVHNIYSTVRPALWVDLGA